MTDAIKNKYGLSERDLKTIFDILEKYPEVKEVHMFGSRAKGSYKQGSDIDLAIMNPGVNPTSIMRISSAFADSSLPYKIDLVDFHTIQLNDFTDHIIRVGIVFYTRQ